MACSSLHSWSSSLSWCCLTTLSKGQTIVSPKNLSREDPDLEEDDYLDENNPDSEESVITCRPMAKPPGFRCHLPNRYQKDERLLASIYFLPTRPKVEETIFEFYHA